MAGPMAPVAGSPPNRNPQHGAATIIDIGVPVSMPQATHRNQWKAPSVEWMGRIRDRDLFGPSIPRPNRGIKKGDRMDPLSVDQQSEWPDIGLRHDQQTDQHRQGQAVEEDVV
jgi:hypothetical protein